MRRLGCLVVLGGLLVELTISARALTWEKRSAEFTLEAGAGDRVFEFPFKNEGKETVNLTGLASSCGCTSPTVDSRVIPSGGTGVIKVNYAPGERVGPQAIRLTITTDEVGAEPVLLQLHINIQPAISLTPRLVHWTKADGMSPRTLEIKRLSQSPVRILEIKPADDRVTAEVKAGPQPDVWLLTLTPKSADEAFTTKVEIRFAVGERTMTYSAFAVMR